LTIPSQTGLRATTGRSHQPAPVVYDITRLVTRALNPSPNGIDRIDFTLARHFLSSPGERNWVFICTCLGPRLAGSDVALQTIDGIEASWNEFIDASEDPIYESAVAALLGAKGRETPGKRMKRRFDAKLLAQNWRALRQWACVAQWNRRQAVERDIDRRFIDPAAPQRRKEQAARFMPKEVGRDRVLRLHPQSEGVSDIGVFVGQQPARGDRGVDDEGHQKWWPS
jgi:hypothetical protein